MVYRPPAASPDFLSRKRLTDTLNKSLKKHRHIYLQAAGGFGKTVAAAQLAATLRGKKAWLAAGEGFLHELARALNQLQKTDALSALAGKTGFCTEDALLAAVERMKPTGKRCYLFLDDLQSLPDGSRVLPALLARLPAYISVVMMGRVAPAFSVHTITAGELKFTAAEIGKLPGVDSEQMVEEIAGVTDGWAIGIRAYLLANSTDGGDALPLTLFRYMDDYVQGTWDSATRDFLLRCSLAPTLTTALAGRLAGQGGDILRRLYTENVFISKIDEDEYRLHDLFREYLQQKVSEAARDEASGILASWYYERGDYYMAAKYYIDLKDMDGINRCLQPLNALNTSFSVEAEYDFAQKYLRGLDRDFIAQNPYLLYMKAWVDFLHGDVEGFTYGIDTMTQNLPQIAQEYPEMAETTGFLGSLDFRMPLRQFAPQVVAMLEQAPPMENGDAMTSSISQNFPFFHRSMRDFSEYHDLAGEDLDTLRNSFGVMIGADYESLDHSLVAGIYYERGELFEANLFALRAYLACDEHTHGEARFCAQMILAAVYEALGAKQQVERLYHEAAELARENDFLLSNFNAMLQMKALRSGDKSGAEDWLLRNDLEHVTYLRMWRHFATIRTLIALGRFEEAAALGGKLHALAQTYRRPLDAIESGILASIALDALGERKQAVELLTQTIEQARPLGFITQFVNEKDRLLPLLIAIQKSNNKASINDFLKKLLAEMTGEPGGAPHITKQQKLMLRYLAQGLSYAQIVERSGLKKSTVKTHIVQLYKALNVSRAQDAVDKARAFGILAK